MANMTRIMDLDAKARQIAEDALQNVESLTVWERFDDISEEDHAEILRLVHRAAVTV